MPSVRDSGKLVGRSASIKQVARRCNLPFPLSLRQFISTPGCPFSRCHHLHIKVLTDPVISIETMLNRMREVYSTAGIGIEVASRENLTGSDFTDLNDIDVGTCAITTSTEQNSLFANRNSVLDSEMVLYFVQSTTKTLDKDGKIISETLNGCATHPAGQPGAIIARIASQWTLAHEVGHVLGLKHISGEKDKDGNCVSADTTRLMTGCSTDDITGTPTFNKNETDHMISSNLTLNC